MHYKASCMKAQPVIHRSRSICYLLSTIFNDLNNDIKHKANLRIHTQKQPPLERTMPDFRRRFLFGYSYFSPSYNRNHVNSLFQIISLNSPKQYYIAVVQVTAPMYFHAS